MMYHPFIHILLFLPPLCDAVALDSQTSSIQRRGMVSYGSGSRPVGPYYGSAANVVATAEKTTPPARVSVPEPERQSAERPGTSADPASEEELRLSGSKLEPYPTRVLNPSFSPDGVRLLAGAVVLDRTQANVLLIQDRVGGKWRFPEGDWAQEEAHIAEAAAREAHGTAGVVSDWKEAIKLDTVATKEAETHYYQIHSLGTSPISLGVGKWESKWASIEEASDLLADGHPEQVRMLELRKSWGTGNTRPVIVEEARQDFMRAWRPKHEYRPSWRKYDIV